MPARYSTRFRILALALLLSLLFACAGRDRQKDGATEAVAEPTVADSASELPVRPVTEEGLEQEVIIKDLDDPWGMDFLADGSLLVTERDGGLLRVWPDSRHTQRIVGLPRVTKVGQGGLLDVMVLEVDGEEPWVYLSYSISMEGGYTTRIMRARLWEDELVEAEILFTAEPAYRTRRHFGSRFVMDGDYLFFSIGDRARRHGAQDLAVHNGKIMRLYADGSVPEDNPFVGVDGTRPEIWSYGHRNPQGLALHADGSLWSSEHGPQGGDEINRVERGANYGWPVITYGEEYGGGAIGEGTRMPGMEQPLQYWSPSIGVCGMAFYSGDVYPGWDDSLLVAALRLTHINRLQIENGKVTRESRLFEDDKKRMRDVIQDPDGYVYALVAGSRLVKLHPAP